MSRSNIGVFYTTNYKHILQGISIPEYVTHIIEPFAGNGDLIPFIKEGFSKNSSNKNVVFIELYDIAPKGRGGENLENTTPSHSQEIIQRDTLLDPPDYTNKFIITNPPYLAKNKNADKLLYKKYDTDDLYKCFLLSILDSKCLGGIVIIPMNFWLSNRQSDIVLRKRFLNTFVVKNVNMFEERVFEDTTYAVCAFLFEKTNSSSKNVVFKIFPSKKKVSCKFSENNDYTIGGEIHKLPINKNYDIKRRGETVGAVSPPFLLAKCIDDCSSKDKSVQKLISLSLVEKINPLYLSASCRAYCYIDIKPPLTYKQKELLVEKWNSFITNERERYHSLFLTIYRENSRRRISYSLLYRTIGYILNSIA